MADPHIADDRRLSPTSEPSLLVERGADGIDHPGGTLGAHLRRVAARLVDHGVDEATRRAGLWHAAYGTDGFPTALVGLDERTLVAAAIGVEAEEQVYLYASCDRSATYSGLGAPIVTFTDRFTGAAGGLPRDHLRTFAAVTVANELDVVDHLALGPTRRSALAAVLAPLRDLLTPAATEDMDATLVEYP